MSDANGQLALLLHAHLPYVRHPEREQEVESRWLFEAITESYLPLVEMLLRLARDGVAARLSLSISPTLTSMLRDPLLLTRYANHLEQLGRLAQAEARRTRGGEQSDIACFYEERIGRARRLWQGIDGDLIGCWSALESAGLLELLTTSATHAFLPYLRPGDAAFLEAQIDVALEAHELQFGRRPRAFWLPECGYEPGLEELLADRGVEAFFVESQGLLKADPTPLYGVHAPILCADGKIACYARDPECSRLVWSATEGYPADPVYREFYRDIVSERSPDELGELAAPEGCWIPTGLKYHRITGKTPRKELYEPAAAAARARTHAKDFIRRRGEAAEALARSMDRPPLFVAPFDAELFGHWWFEGPLFLEEVLRRAARGDEGLALVTTSDDRRAHPRAQLARPAASSWGDGGHGRYWLNEENAWIYRQLRRVGDRVDTVLKSSPSPCGATGLWRRGANAVVREMLLAQASDWPFLMTSGTGSSYAEQRVREHLGRAAALVEQMANGAIDEEELRQLERSVPLFSGVDVYSSVYC